MYACLAVAYMYPCMRSNRVQAGRANAAIVLRGVHTGAPVGDEIKPLPSFPVPEVKRSDHRVRQRQPEEEDEQDD